MFRKVSFSLLSDRAGSYCVPKVMNLQVVIRRKVLNRSMWWWHGASVLTAWAPCKLLLWQKRWCTLHSISWEVFGLIQQNNGFYMTELYGGAFAWLASLQPKSLLIGCLEEENRIATVGCCQKQHTKISASRFSVIIYCTNFLRWDVLTARVWWWVGTQRVINTLRKHVTRVYQCSCDNGGTSWRHRTSWRQTVVSVKGHFDLGFRMWENHVFGSYLLWHKADKIYTRGQKLLVFTGLTVSLFSGLSGWCFFHILKCNYKHFIGFIDNYFDFIQRVYICRLGPSFWSISPRHAVNQLLL